MYWYVLLCHAHHNVFSLLHQRSLWRTGRLSTLKWTILTIARPQMCAQEIIVYKIRQCFYPCTWPPTRSWLSVSSFVVTTVTLNPAAWSTQGRSLLANLADPWRSMKNGEDPDENSRALVWVARDHVLGTFTGTTRSRIKIDSSFGGGQYIQDHICIIIVYEHMWATHDHMRAWLIMIMYDTYHYIWCCMIICEHLGS